MHLYCLLNNFSKFNEKKVYEPHYFISLWEKFIHMRIVKKGEDTFVEFSDFNEVREVFEEAIKEIEEEKKANARRPSYAIRSPK
jgi:hypothetical protein